MKRNAFTLVELSIVLVILGLLVGGVLTGQSLIRAAELRSVMTQHTSYVTAINAFKDKYMMLPGDITNASNFWPSCVTSPAPERCNGNGDGRLEGTIVSGVQALEHFRAWQHLSLAGLISGDFSINNTTATTADASANIVNFAPKSKIKNASFGFSHAINYGGFIGARNYLLMFGVFAEEGVPCGGILTPSDTWGIDTKMDDGLPNSGKTRGLDGMDAGYDPISPSCINGAAYRLNSNTASCALIFYD